MNETEEDFVRLGMSQMGVNLVLIERGITIRGLACLKRAGVKTMLELNNSLPVEGIPTQEWQTMVDWCEKVRKRLATEHRLGYKEPYSWIQKSSDAEGKQK